MKRNEKRQGRPGQETRPSSSGKPAGREEKAAESAPGSCDLAVIGAGAAGLSCAIAAARTLKEQGLTWDGKGSDGSVVVIDALSRPGRKLGITGNGRCNLTNSLQSRDCYRSGDGILKEQFYQDGWDGEICAFMESVGILTLERQQGCLYPRTGQAVSVAEALIRETQRLGVRILCKTRVKELRGRPGGGFKLGLETGKEESAGLQMLSSRRVVLSSGGLAAPELGCQGDGYRLAQALGHEIVRPVPALCALHCEEPFLAVAAGVRTFARVSLCSGGKILASSQGELQMTERGISGIPAFQISRYAAKKVPLRDAGGPYEYRAALDADSEEPLTAVLDFLPELTKAQWEEECARRLFRVSPSDTLGDFLRGLVPDKIAAWILAGQSLVREKKIGNLSPDAALRERALHKILADLRCRELKVTGTDGFSRAQVTAGGITLDEVSEQMESRLSKGLYFAGEVLDVDGICGGYNLTWAIHSGLLAGRAAAASLTDNRG